MAFLKLQSAELCVEIGAETLKVLRRDQGREFPIERQANGRFTPSCKERLRRDLSDFVRGPRRLGRPRALCAVEARGVSLRRLTLPAAAKEDFQRLMTLQIEKEFPLPPSELAWGACEAGRSSIVGGSPSAREWTVAAVKREVMEEYADLLESCGLVPVFTVGALAASALCTSANASFALLDIGRAQSELVVIEEGVPISVRALPCGSESADRLAAMVRGHWTGNQLFLCGSASACEGVADDLVQQGAGPIQCELLKIPAGAGMSAVTWGLRQWFELNGRCPPLVLQVPRGKQSTLPRERPARWAWAFLALSLAFGSFLMRYAEAILYKPRLVQRMNEAKSVRALRPDVDRELAFFQYIGSNQPPCLELLEALAEAAPGGSKFESLALTRQGELTVRGTLEGSKAATDLRAKMIASGWFSSVVLEEQTPAPNQNDKVTVRLRARWKFSKTAPAAAIAAKGKGTSPDAVAAESTP